MPTLWDLVLANSPFKGKSLLIRRIHDAPTPPKPSRATLGGAYRPPPTNKIQHRHINVPSVDGPLNYCNTTTNAEIPLKRKAPSAPVHHRTRLLPENKRRRFDRTHSERLLSRLPVTSAGAGSMLGTCNPLCVPIRPGRPLRAAAGRPVPVN